MTIDLSKIKKDTKVYVRNDKNEKWEHSHFANYLNGKILCYSCGATSWTTTAVSQWKYLELAMTIEK